jgi:hypothetical protein
MMIKTHIKTPNTKLETEADTIELATTRMISDTVVISSGCCIIPSRTEKIPAIHPEMSA